MNASRHTARPPTGRHPSDIRPRREVRGAPVRLVLAVTLLGLAALGSGCDATTAPDGRPGAAASIKLAPPPALTRLRLLVPNPDAVSVRLTLDGAEIPLSAADGSGDDRVASFPASALPVDGSASVLVATWFYDAGSSTVELARSPPVEVRRDDGRDIVIDSYDTGADADEDGLSNLDELLVGRDPLVAGPGEGVSPASGPDCRSFMPEGVSRPFALPAIVELERSTVEAITVMPNSFDGGSWYAAFRATSAGSLRISHLAGQPADTDALFYRRAPDLDRVEPFVPRTVLVFYDTLAAPPDGRRAIIPVPPSTTARVEPSIVYCYVLTARDAAGSGAVATSAPLLDTVVEIGFEPDG